VRGAKTPPCKKFLVRNSHVKECRMEFDIATEEDCYYYVIFLDSLTI
jgi:hypothetical protein